MAVFRIERNRDYTVMSNHHLRDTGLSLKSKGLAGQNAGLSNIEITEKNIRCFTQTAKKYHVDFALKKDTASEQPRYLVFFKSRDADAITAAFQEFTARKLHRKPFLRAQLAQAVKEAEKQPKPLEKELVKEKDRGVER